MMIEKWVEIEGMFTELMGHNKGIGAMVDIKRDVAPKKPICDLSKREDDIILHRLRKKYRSYKNSRRIITHEDLENN